MLVPPAITVAITIYLVVVFLIPLSILVYRGGEEGQPDPRPQSLKISTDCPKTSHDFIVDLECPDGTVVRVEIPVDPSSYEGRCSRARDEHEIPVGLNLVCPGHYT